jgi:hypothetical protein
MKIQRIAIVVTVINLILMAVLLTKMNAATAQQKQNNSQILRGSGLQITDTHGRIRASISFHEAIVTDSVTYPAGVLFRLITTKGQPSVKIEASEDGGGLSFANESQGYIQLMAKESGGILKIKNPDGKEQVVKP